MRTALVATLTLLASGGGVLGADWSEGYVRQAFAVDLVFAPYFNFEAGLGVATLAVNVGVFDATVDDKPQLASEQRGSLFIIQSLGEANKHTVLTNCGLGGFVVPISAAFEALQRLPRSEQSVSSEALKIECGTSPYVLPSWYYEETIRDRNTVNRTSIHVAAVEAPSDDPRPLGHGGLDRCISSQACLIESIGEELDGIQAGSGGDYREQRHGPLSVGVLPRVEISYAGYSLRDTVIFGLLYMCGVGLSYLGVRWIAKPRHKNNRGKDQR